MQEALEAGPSHRGPVLRIHLSSAAAGRPRRVACKRSDEPGTREDACSKGSQSEVGLERASRRRWHVHRDDGWEAMMWSGRGWGRGGSGRDSMKFNKEPLWSAQRAKAER